MLSEEKIKEEKTYNNKFNTSNTEKKFDPLAFFSRQNMHYLKTNGKKNRITQLLENNYMDNHPFCPKLIAEADPNKSIHVFRNVGEELNNFKIPVYEKLYKYFLFTRFSAQLKFLINELIFFSYYL